MLRFVKSRRCGTRDAQAAWAASEAEVRAEHDAASEEQRHSASEALNVLKLSLEAQARLEE